MATDKVELSKDSMFSNTPVYQVGQDIVFGLRQPVISNSSDDVQVTVTQTMSGRLDKIANQLYGSSDLWWIIADSNNMLDPFVETVTGAKLRVPPSSTVKNATS